jgi:hypothetical protein
MVVSWIVGWRCRNTPDWQWQWGEYRGQKGLIR